MSRYVPSIPPQAIDLALSRYLREEFLRIQQSTDDIYNISNSAPVKGAVIEGYGGVTQTFQAVQNLTDTWVNCIFTGPTTITNPVGVEYAPNWNLKIMKAGLYRWSWICNWTPDVQQVTRAWSLGVYNASKFSEPNNAESANQFCPAGQNGVTATASYLAYITEDQVGDEWGMAFRANGTDVYSIALVTKWTLEVNRVSGDPAAQAQLQRINGRGSKWR